MEPDLRVSDEDREKAATEIREHYAAGRLDADELGERLERAYAARTAADLAAVRANLPALPAPRNGWHLYGPAPDLDRVDEELRRRGRERSLPPPPPPP